MLDDKPFEVYNGELKVQIQEYEKFVYPDAMVVSEGLNTIKIAVIPSLIRYW